MALAAKGQERISGWRRGAFRQARALCGVGVVALVPAPVFAADPGTHIDNVAMLRFAVGGVDRSIPSNTASIVVAERLDLTLVRTGSGSVAHDPHTVIATTLTNTGSGHEAFDVTATVGAAAATGAIVAIDVDGNGRYDPAHDTLLTNGRTPTLAPGASVALLVVADTSAPDTTSLTIAAKAATASGTPGTVAAGAGDGGGDAIVGTTGATASVTIGIADANTPPTLTKTQAVHAPDGSDKPVSGAVVTYTLDATFGGATAGVRIADPVPAGTRYVAGSLTLDGAALSDAADADAGQSDGTTVAVTIGAIPSASTHRVQFQVQIQ
ncbi:hypothetical protein [Sphingomonas bacterium]|uniref:hypothetical protein n=1 Tax=Sphingomonas bacterium TaxID=1895847 RepID=UPI001577282A|nr:hypothetical protein [Sphingomonas bacterium]